MRTDIVDWAAPSIKLEKLHKRLDDCLNDKKHSEAFSILLEMQGEVLKLQRFVLYGIDAPKQKRGLSDEYTEALKKTPIEFVKDVGDAMNARQSH